MAKNTKNTKKSDEKEAKELTEKTRVEVAKKLKSLRNKFEGREKLEPGKRYRRTWYNEFKEKGWLTVDFIMNQAAAIAAKRSSLNARNRKVVQEIFNESITKAFNLGSDK